MTATTSSESFDLISLSVDVEWAHDDVLADLVELIDARRLKATFFCTHPGIRLGSHERALHPNFLSNGDMMRSIGAAARERGDDDAYRHVVQTTLRFCPEAIGVRGHRQFFDSGLLPIYRAAGLQYDSSLLLLLAEHLAPTRKPHDIVELPIYYIDHSDLSMGLSGMTVDGLRLQRPGLKIFDFHPNTVYINAESIKHYDASKAWYRDPGRLLGMRHAGRGVRTLFIELLDFIADRGIDTPTLAEVNHRYRNRAE